MSRRLIVCFIFLGLIILGFVNFGTSNLFGTINGNVVLSENEKSIKNTLGMNEEILKTFDDKNEKVRVIVLDKNISDTSKIKTYKDKINKTKHSYSSIDGFSAEITLEEFKILKKSGLHIFKDKIYHTNLDFSIPQISANDAWNLKSNSLNLTGSGQTVCIIDTGIDYNHSAFGNCYGANNVSSTCKIIGGYDFVNNDEFPMDDNGHGTHVAGIVASSNNTYRGVSPNAKIISIKALNNEGSGFGADIIAGIDWCVNNASIFNISIISMSLGDCSNHTTYCNNDAMAPSINAAVAKNISVVISAGNGNGGACIDIVDTIGPSSPACVESAIAVGRVDDNDVISLQRGPLFELMAPGVNIMSALLGGNFIEAGGTSMSTPHIAGAIALINQYLSLSGQMKTPSEIKIVLNNTGKNLDDSAGSGYNFSRIDVYSALLSLDIDTPNATLISPTNNKINLTANQTFVCNATDWQLANVTLKVWNSTGELYYNTTNNLTGTTNGTSFDLNDMPEGSYDWDCFVSDVEGNSDFASSNYSLIIGGIAVSLLSPLNNSYTNVGETNFTCESNSEITHELSNVTFYLWNSSALVKNEMKNISGTINETTFNWTFVEEESYIWNCLGMNNGSNESWGYNNFSIIYDVTSPNLSSLSESVSSSGATITWVTENDSSNSSISGDISGSSTDYVTSHSVSISGLSASTTYSYIATSCDRAGNCNDSSDSFTTSAIVSSGGGSGGGSGFSSAILTPKTYEVSVAEVAGGYTQSLKKNEKINFNIFDFEGGRHLLTVDKVGTDYVELIIESEPINLKLGIGQSAKLNLTSDSYYDLFIKLNKITGDSVELTIQLINEPIKVEVVEAVEEEIVKTEDMADKNYSWLIIILVIALITAVNIIILLIIKVTQKLKRKITSKKKVKKHGKKIKT